MALAGSRAQPLCVAGCRDRASADGAVLLEEDAPVSDVVGEGQGTVSVPLCAKRYLGKHARS
eukprot:14947078-Alexandrium_andersonii.AAC.1